jgi:hypothetical protein
VGLHTQGDHGYQEAEARGRQRGFDLQAEAIELRDTDSRRALTDAQELYASAEARAAVVIKQEEDVEVVLRHFHRCRYWSSTVVVLLLEGALVSWLLAMREYGGHKDLRGSGRRSVIPYVHG